MRTPCAAVGLGVVLVLGSVGCNHTPPTSSECVVLQQSGAAALRDSVLVWLACVKDTYVSCGNTAPSCPEGDLNFGTSGQLVTAEGLLTHKRTYVQFTNLCLPAGTELREAYLELYHSGRNEDGQTDDVDIPVQRMSYAWSPSTLTWNNAPDRNDTKSSITALDLKSQAWSGSGNIASEVSDMFANPDDDHGFIVHAVGPLGPPTLEKGYYSNNDIRRKSNDLGLAPRLLLKIVLPAGTTTDDILARPMPSDNDLTGLARPVLLVRYAGGTLFPVTWGASKP